MTGTLWEYAPRDPRPDPVLTLQQKYELWRATPDGQAVVRAVTEAALRLRHRGFRHYGIAAIWEKVRYDHDLRVGPDGQGYRLNNSWRSRLARELMERPDLAGFFELRELKA